MRNCPARQKRFRARQLQYSLEPPNRLTALAARYVVSVSFRARIVIILELGDAQTLQPVPLHRVVPRAELIDRQAIALAYLLNCDYAAQHRCDNRGFTPRSPALGVGRRQMDKSCASLPQNLAFRRPLNTMFLAITTAPSFTHRRSGGWFPTTLSSSSLICLIDFAARHVDWVRGALFWYFRDGAPTGAPGQYVKPRMNGG